MKVLNEIKYLARSHNAEHWYLYDRLLALLSTEFITKFKLAFFTDKLKTQFAREDEAYSAITKSVSTAEIADKDKARDSGLRRVDLGVQYGLYSDVPDEVEAAKRCMLVLDAHRGASEKSYAENTAEVADVVQLNDAFNEAYTNRKPEQYARSTGDKMEVVRGEVDAAYADVADAINAIYIVAAYLEPVPDDAAEIKAVADAMNAEIYQFGLTLARRGVGTVTEPDEPADPEPSDPTDPTDPEGAGRWRRGRHARRGLTSLFTPDGINGQKQPRDSFPRPTRIGREAVPLVI